MFMPLSMFDPTPYQRTPQLPLRGLCTLAETLAALTPPLAPAYIEVAASAMLALVEAAQAAMLERMREADEATMVADTVLDNAIDGLWRLLRDSLRRWSSYAHAGLDWLDEDAAADALGVEQLRAHGERAAQLERRLFGAEGIESLKRRYPEQLQIMGSWLELIAAEQLEQELVELSDPYLLPILRRAQEHYAAMVQRRASKNSRARADLRVVRAQLQRAIGSYAALVLTLVDPEKPSSVELVEAALRPMVNLRAGRSGADASELESSGEGEVESGAALDSEGAATGEPEA